MPVVGSLSLVVGVDKFLDSEDDKVAFCGASHSDSSCPEFVVSQNRNRLAPVRTQESGEFVPIAAPVGIVGVVIPVTLFGNETVSALDNLEIASECTFRCPFERIVSLGIIISVNSDPDAPINSIADYVIVGTVEEVVPKLIKYYKQNNK